jgi:hypothetical protein
MQWNAFIRKNKLRDTASFENIIASLRDFSSPIILAINNQKEFRAIWKAPHWSI